MDIKTLPPDNKLPIAGAKEENVPINKISVSIPNSERASPINMIRQNDILLFELVVDPVEVNLKDEILASAHATGKIERRVSAWLVMRGYLYCCTRYRPKKMSSRALNRPVTPILQKESFQLYFICSNASRRIFHGQKMN